MAIRSFANKTTKDIAMRAHSKKALKLLPKALHYSAYKKLVFLDNATSLQDLLAWRSLNLEKLRGERAGQLSIRINEQYRICFKWIDNTAHDVEVVDYHRG